MKLNKKISKFLVLGMLTNNIYFNSNANADIPNRYETLEGEFITIDSSTEGNLEEIEIFGNTVQDSGSKNLFNSKLEKGHIYLDGSLVSSAITIRSTDYTEVKPNTNYSIGIVGYSGNLYIHEYDKNNSHLEEKTLPPSQVNFRTGQNTKYIKINTYSGQGYELDIDAKVQFNEGNTLLDYEPYRAPNLEDIQSVGDLYVDVDGNPILDRQGREQYKVNIISSNTNGFYEENNMFRDYNTELVYGHGREHYINEDAIIVHYKSSSISRTDFKIEGVKPNKKYRLIADFKLNTDNNNSILNISNGSNVIVFRGSNYTQSEIVSINQKINLTANSTSDGTLTISFFNVYFTSSGVSFNGEVSLNNIRIGEDIGHTDELEEPKFKSQTIILPTQLQKVGDIADRLYWDNSKGRYLIEKNITSIVLDGSEEWIDSSTTGFSTINDSDYITFHNILLFGKYPVDSGFVSNNFNYLRYDGGFRWTGDYEGISDGGGYNFIFIRINKSKLETPDVEGFKKWLNNNPTTVWYQLKIPKIINSNITSKLNIPTFEGKTHIYVNSENGINPTLKVTLDRLPQIANEAINQAENNSTSNNISLARMYANMLPESLYKDQLQEQLNQVFSSDITLDRKSASSNLDIYVKSQNMLSLSLDTNSITFEGYSGVDAMEMLSAVNISINSSLPYDLNAYIPSEISNADGTNIMDLDILNIRESSEAAYQTFENTTDKIVLKSDCAKGNGNIHNIDLKLDSNTAHKADIYKTVIKFEVEQK